MRASDPLCLRTATILKLLALGILAGTLSNATAGTLILNALAANEQFQQTTNNPCVIGEPSCKQPAGFPLTVFPPNDATFDGSSPEYTVSQITQVAGGDFIMGLDVNQTNNPQTLSLFEMLVNGIVVDTYNTTILVPPTAGGGNGNGYADYTFTGFTSLSGYADDAVVEFHAVMSGLNDGREQFFLIHADGGGGGGGAVVPEPATIAMLGLGCLALGFRRYRHAK